jgi:hypothetical protein
VGVGRRVEVESGREEDEEDADGLVRGSGDLEEGGQDGDLLASVGVLQQ